MGMNMDDQICLQYKNYTRLEQRIYLYNVVHYW